MGIHPAGYGDAVRVGHGWEVVLIIFDHQEFSSAFKTLRGIVRSHTLHDSQYAVPRSFTVTGIHCCDAGSVHLSCSVVLLESSVIAA